MIATYAPVFLLLFVSGAIAALFYGAATFLGGILHTLPFLIPTLALALAAAIVVVAIELVALAWIRWRFFHTSFLRSFVTISLAGAVIATVSGLLGSAAS